MEKSHETAALLHNVSVSTATESFQNRLQSVHTLANTSNIVGVTGKTDPTTEFWEYENFFLKRINITMQKLRVVVRVMQSSGFR